MSSFVVVKIKIKKYYKKLNLFPKKYYKKNYKKNYEKYFIKKKEYF